MDVGETPAGTQARQARSSEEVIQIAIRLVLLAGLTDWSFILLISSSRSCSGAWCWRWRCIPPTKWPPNSTSGGGRPRIAALLITFAVLAVIFGPAAWLGIGLVEGLRNVLDLSTSGALTIPTPPDSVKSWPIIGATLHEYWQMASVNLEFVFREFAPYLKPLTGPVLAIAGSAGTGTLMFLVAVIISGFLYPYGPSLAAAGHRALTRIVADRSESFLALAGATIRTVLQGVIGVAVI